MKKVLFATTALIATAGVAAAEVSFGGYGRFGAFYSEGATNEFTITSRFRLQIDATAESDGGVQFGARVRMQQDNDDLANEYTGGPTPDASTPGGSYNAREGDGMNGVRFFARAGGFEVGVGNIFGALEYMPGQYPIDLGLTGLGYEYTAYAFGGAAYNSDDNGSAGRGGIEVMYSFGDFSAHVSMDEVDADAPFNGNLDTRIAGVVAYTFNGWTVALGAQESDIVTDTELTATVGGTIGPVDVTLAYADNGTLGDHLVLAGRFDVGANTNIEAYVADADAMTDTSWGIDFNHSLGGGTSLRGGIMQSGYGGNMMADLGVRFNF